MKIAVIRTSDRGTFKRCRRKWAFQSGHRMNRAPAQRENYFWIGTVGHFAMEDYHGYNHYGHPVEAAKACYEAFKRANKATKNKEQLPDDHSDQMQLLIGILDHYLLWLKNRDTFQTYWVDGKPQVEVKAWIPLPIPEEILAAYGYDEVHYEVTLDRVVYDEYGRYWVLDYKFLKQFQTMHLDYDQQASAYIWAANTLYDKFIEGFIVQQFRKAVPIPPPRGSKGTITTNLQTLKSTTTYELYREALKDMYGSVRKAPIQYGRVLGELAAMEGEDRNEFIRRDKTVRNQAQIEATGTKIVLEAIDMLNPDLPLYPNETKDCYWDCSFRDICQMMDREDHWQDVLEETTIDRKEETESWRKYLP